MDYIACRPTKVGWFGKAGLVYWCLMALSAQAGYTVPMEYEIYYVGPGTRHNTQLHNETMH